MIEPTSRSVLAAPQDVAPPGEAASLIQFRHNVAGTISFGKRLCLFQNEILVLSRTVSS